MGIIKISLAVLVAALAVIAYLAFSVDMPDDMSHRFQARMFTGIGRIFVCLSNAAAYLGYSKMALSRAIMPGPGEFTTLDNKDNPSVQNTVDDFDGVPVRIYEPAGRSRGGPAIVFLHGGGWVWMNTGAYHPTVQRIANTTKYLVISVEYRKAPKHRYPAAINDCIQATEFLMKHAQRFGIDPKRVAVMGDSAGGNLAAAVSIAMRNKNKALMPKLQVPIYPVLQAIDFNLPSYQNDTRIVLSRKDMYFFVLAYLLGTTSDDMNPTITNLGDHNRLVSESVWKKHGHKLSHSLIPKANFHKEYTKVKVPEGHVGFSEELDKLVVEPLFSPLMADDLKDLPRTLLVTCQYDVLRDESFIYAKRLNDAGVRVEHVNDRHCYHGIFSIIPDHPLFWKTCDFLIKNL